MLYPPWCPSGECNIRDNWSAISRNQVKAQNILTSNSTRRTDFFVPGNPEPKLGMVNMKNTIYQQCSSPDCCNAPQYSRISWGRTPWDVTRFRYVHTEKLGFDGWNVCLLWRFCNGILSRSRHRPTYTSSSLMKGILLETLWIFCATSTENT